MSKLATKPRDRVALVPAVLREARQVIIEHHYLHRGRTMAQLAYWIEVDGTRVGVVLFALPRMSVSFHGYHPMSLIELARLWIDPSVQGTRVFDRVGHEHSFAIAGCAVALALRRIRTDWRQKYPHLPDLRACVAWADTSLHRGTVYRATNFREVGTSGGRQPGRWTRPVGGRHQQHDDYRRLKTTFLYTWHPTERFANPQHATESSGNGSRRA